jgi:hypothetical protein
MRTRIGRSTVVWQSLTLLLLVAIFAYLSMAAERSLDTVSDRSVPASKLNEIQDGGEPYPLPLASVTPSPTPGGSGLYEAPEGVPIVITSLDAPPWAGELGAIEAAFDDMDAAALAAYVQVNGIHVTYGASGYSGLGPAEVETVLSDLFAASSAPKIQGYFTAGCLLVITTGWVGQVALPTATPSLLPPIDAPGPVIVEGPAILWEVCKMAPDSDQPVIRGWTVGGYYHEMVRATYVVLKEMADDGGQYGPADYHVIRP